MALVSCQVEHRAEVQKRESQYQAKIMEEVERFQQLQMETELQKVGPYSLSLLLSFFVHFHLSCIPILLSFYLHCLLFFLLFRGPAINPYGDKDDVFWSFPLIKPMFCLFLSFL